MIECSNRTNYSMFLNPNSTQFWGKFDGDLPQAAIPVADSGAWVAGCVGSLMDPTVLPLAPQIRRVDSLLN